MLIFKEFSIIFLNFAFNGQTSSVGIRKYVKRRFWLFLRGHPPSGAKNGQNKPKTWKIIRKKLLERKREFTYHFFFLLFNRAGKCLKIGKFRKNLLRADEKCTLVFRYFFRSENGKKNLTETIISISCSNIFLNLAIDDPYMKKLQFWPKI